ncbi:MAG: glycosyltransferase [Pirellulales bacterium]|nr:glycosyltransferase [Pirellulales bacterium]
MAIQANILYVGNFFFPDGDAGGSRVRGIGLALRDAGYSVAFAGSEYSAPPEDLRADGLHCRDGLCYCPAKSYADCKTARLRRAFFLHFTASETMNRVRRLTSEQTRAIVVYNGTAILLWRLMNYCRRRGLALLADCTEWFDPAHLPGGSIGPLRWDSELRMRRLQPKVANLIVISSFLEQYYRARGCRTLRVPPLVDLQAPCWRPIPPPREDSELHLAYAGTPGKKDFLTNALRAAIALRAEGFPIKVHLVGATRESLGNWLRRDPGFIEDLGDAVVYHGRVPQARAIELISAADFTILLREDKRYAHAGFPTKLVESLSAGVPIVANATSDIPEYVRDGQEGILLEDHSPEAFAAGVRRIFRMPKSKWREMRFAARQRAEECFDYRRYIVPLADFIERTCARNARGGK